MRTRRVIGIGLGTLVVLATAGYALAYMSTPSSGFARAIVWREADVMDYKRFPSRIMESSADPLELERSPGNSPPLSAVAHGGDLESFLRDSQTAAFIMIRDDVVIYEEYFNGYDSGSTVTSFSVAKPFISTLVGIASEEGDIGSIDDPVTDYVPELMRRDIRFSEITLRHLLTMSSGLRWSERGLPWSDDADTYYGTDLRRVAIRDTEIVGPPGVSFVYNPYNTLLLGLVLERRNRSKCFRLHGRKALEAYGGFGYWIMESRLGGWLRKNGSPDIDVGHRRLS